MKSYREINIACLFFSVVVVAIHTSPFNIKNEIFNRVLIIIYELAVPFYFVKCGFFLREKEIIKVLRKYTYIYIIWTIIYLPLTMYEYVVLDLQDEAAIDLFLKGFFVYGKHFYSQQFWYILSTIYGLLLIWMLIDQLKWNKNFLFLTSMLFYMVAVNVFVDYKISRMFLGMVYISVGMILNDISSNIKLSQGISLFIIAFSVKYFISDGYVSLVANMIMAVSLFSILLNLKCLRRDNDDLRKISTCIFYIHTYVIFAIETVCGLNHPTLGWKMFLATVIASMLIGMGYICINKKILKLKNAQF